MVSTSNTTPSSCGATTSGGSDAPPTPKKLTLSDSIDQHDPDPVDTAAEISSSHTFASTPSSSPNNASTTGGDNLVIQDRHVRSEVVDDTNRVETVLGLRKSEGKEPKYDMSTVMFGCMFAYIVLGIWIWTIVTLIYVVKEYKCDVAFEDELEGIDASEDGISDTSGGPLPKLSHCVVLFTGKLACAHSITFGLISAVVIHETGSSSDDSAKQRLSSITKPVLKRRQANNANFIQRALYSVIISLPAIYVVAWSIFGLLCFIYSISSPDGASGPLFYTGQTWLGITIRASYSFFGVREDPSSSSDELSNRSHRAAQLQEYDEETGLLQHKNYT